MATLGNIRKHGVLLLVVVGVAMLAFIVGDFISSSNSYFNRKRENVGVIEGHKVHYTDYEAAKDQLKEVYKIETGRQDFDEDMEANIRNSVWQMLVSEYTLGAQAEKIGLAVTKAELDELCLGENPHQLIRSRRAFYDQTGNFNRMYLISFINQLSQDVDDPQQQELINQYKKYWMYWENAVRLTSLQEKYMDLLQNAITANSLDAEFAFKAKQENLAVTYTCKPFYAVADSLVTVKDADVKKLYKKLQKQYKQEPNRDLTYVAFPVVPSKADFEEAESLLKGLQQEFYTTDDVMTVVNLNSDFTYNGQNFSEETVPAQYKEFAFAKGAKAGDVTELTFDPETNTYAMARIVAAGYSVPDSVKLVAVAAEEGQENQELGWFTEADLAGNKELAEKAFAAKKGEKVSVSMGVNSQEFIVEEISAATPKVKLAILGRVVTASSKTYATIFNEAKQFVVANPTEEKFVAAAEEAGMATHPALGLLATTDKVDQLKSSRAIVRWAFGAKEGAVSDVFECGDQFIVAALTDVKDGEYRPMSDVEAELRFRLINEKKADYLAEQLKGVASVEEAAERLGMSVLDGTVSLAQNRMGGMNDAAAVGAAFALKEGETSAAVKGNAGVYVIKAGAKTAEEGEFNKEAEMAQLNMRYAYSLPYQALGLIEDHAEIEDNRANFQ